VQETKQDKNELQRRIASITKEAKKRFSMTPPRGEAKFQENTPRSQKYKTYVTESGQEILFLDDAVNVPAELAD